MARCKIDKVAVRGVVCAVPGKPHNVDEFGAAFDPQEVEKIKSTVGLRQVYRVQEGQTAGDLCTEAANVLLIDLGWDRDSVDGLIMVTQCPDYVCPATACVVHGKLALSASTFAYDVNLGCSGYVYGLWMASQAIASGTAKRVVLLAGDTISRSLSPEDKSVAMLFGDAGTATALEFDVSASPMSYVLGTDGSGYANLIMRGGGFRMRPTPEAFARTKGEDGSVRSPMDLYMDGLAIFNFTLQRVGPLVSETLALQGWSAQQVDAFLFHQANAFMLKTLAKKMKLPTDRVPLNIGKYGNTSMSSIPLLMADDFSERLRGDKPQNLLLAAFGIGYSWAAVAATLSGIKTAKVISTEATAECLIHSTSAAS
jgi:3-oxoacyl-[acyl-carrier-protein] synthase-3